ncbi:MAG TPA: dihydrofolate reductase family protein [Chryseosolibacter sp.]
MRRIIYYVASSIDGFISGRNEDISGFVGTGNGVDKYLEDLNKFDTVIMGKNTYEFGYKFGLKAGQAPYKHMKNYVISESLSFSSCDPNVYVIKRSIAEIEKIQRDPGTDIYLCGGGKLASWLLEHKKIMSIKLKLNPLIQGQGTPLFQNSNGSFQLKLVEHQEYEHGLLMITYDVNYQ